MMRAKRDALRKAMMADWLDKKDVPANCEVQVKARSGISVQF